MRRTRHRAVGRHAVGRGDVAPPVVGTFNASEPARRARRAARERRPLDDALAALARAARRRRAGCSASAATAQPLVVVDYAHTPDALEKVLAALRPAVAEGGELVCVFGCGGDRDPGKRPEMGRIAAALRRPRRRHQRQPAQRGSGGDRQRRRRGHSRRGQPALVAIELDRARRDRAARSRAREAGDVVLDRRQGPRDLPGTRRRAHAVLRRRRGGRGARGMERAHDGHRDRRARRRRPRHRRATCASRASTTDSRALAPGDLFVALEGRALRRPRFRRAPRWRSGAAAALVAADRADALPGNLHRGRRSARRARHARGALARAVRRCRWSSSSAATARRR